MVKQANKMRGLKLALAGYLVLLVLQITAYFMTDILVLLAIAFETLASILIATLLLLAALHSEKPPDEVYMFGYERAQNIAALISAVIFISFLALETLRQAIPKFFQAPEVIQSQESSIALIVAVISLLVCIIPIIDILRVKVKGASLKAQLVSSLEDVLAYGSGVVGVILAGRGYYLADPIVSLIVATLIAASGIYLIKENVPYLLGKGPGREFSEKLELVAMSVEGVLSVHDFKAAYIGPETIHSGFHIDVAKGTPIEEADRIVKAVKERIGRETGCQHCVIQVEPVNSHEHKPLREKR